MGNRNLETQPSITKFQMKPQVHRINKGAMSTATAETSTVAIAEVTRKSSEDEAMRSMRDASINSFILWIFSITSFKEKDIHHYSGTKPFIFIVYGPSTKLLCLRHLS